MKYLFDTNACIIYLKGIILNLKQRLESVPIQEIAVCSIVKSELCLGAMKNANSEQDFALQQALLAQFDSLLFNELAATTFGVIRVQSKNRGIPTGAYDLQIAASAFANNLTLATHNTREFGRVNWLQVGDGEVEV